MSDNLHTIISKYFYLLRSESSQPIYSSLAELAGKILADLYNSDLLGRLDTVSKVILEAPHCMKCIITILTKMRTIPLENAIKDVYNSLIDTDISKEIKQIDTLANIFEDTHDELEKQFVNEKDFENQLISSIDEKLREARLRGSLDEDTRLFATHPDHIDKLRLMYKKFRNGSEIPHLITEEFNKLSTPQPVQQPVHQIQIDPSFTPNDKDHLFSIEERIKQTVTRHMESIHANLDHLGESLFMKIEEVRIVQAQHADSMNMLITVINEISELLSERIVKEIFPKLIDEIVHVPEHIAKDAKELQKRVLKHIKEEIVNVIDTIKTDIPIMTATIRKEIIQKLNEKL